jgi:hypothetical protein
MVGLEHAERGLMVGLEHAERGLMVDLDHAEGVRAGSGVNHEPPIDVFAPTFKPRSVCSRQP